MDDPTVPALRYARPKRVREEDRSQPAALMAHDHR
jgi:hypothetical protein